MSVKANSPIRIISYRLGYYNDDYTYIKNRLLSDDRFIKKLKEIKTKNSIYGNFNSYKLGNQSSKHINSKIDQKIGAKVDKTTNSLNYTSNDTSCKVSVKSFNLPIIQTQTTLTGTAPLKTIPVVKQSTYLIKNFNDSFSRSSLGTPRSTLQSREKKREIELDNIRLKNKIKRVSSPFKKENFIKNYEDMKKISERIRKIKPASLIMKKVDSLKNKSNSLNWNTLKMSNGK
jgi:hypothetical protein